MKRILFVTIAVLIGLAANAQKVQYGVRGGLNVSKETDHILNVVDYGTIELDTHFRPGLNVGGFINIPSGDKFAFEAGVSYSMLGYKDKIYEMEASDDYFYAEVMSHYFTIPIAEKFYPFGSGLFIEFGPQLGFLLSKKATLNDDAGYTPFKGDNNTFDFAILGGLGYRFTDNIFLHARYIHSLTETSKDYEGGKNKNIQISLGFLL